jgi:hypothetical protein
MIHFNKFLDHIEHPYKNSRWRKNTEKSRIISLTEKYFTKNQSIFMKTVRDYQTKKNMKELGLFPIGPC